MLIWHDSLGRKAVKNLTFGFIPGKTLEERIVNARALAHKVDAQMVVFGYLTDATDPESLQLEFFFDGQERAGEPSAQLYIFDGEGREIHQRTEQNAAYCAFAGGEPDCNIWYFGDHGDAWPSGEAIRYGESYLLRGIVNAVDGRSTTVEMTVVIWP